MVRKEAHTKEFVELWRCVGTKVRGEQAATSVNRGDIARQKSYDQDCRLTAQLYGRRGPNFIVNLL